MDAKAKALKQSKSEALLFALLKFMPNPPARKPITVADWELEDLLPAHQIKEIQKGRLK